MKKLTLLLALLLLSLCLTGCGGVGGSAEEPALCTYTVSCRGLDGRGLAGVMINFCTETTCTPVSSGEDGNAVFTGAPEAYHVQIIRIPEGWELEGQAEWTTEAGDQDFSISFREAGT